MKKTIFSAIHSRYYDCIYEVLKQSTHKDLDKKDIYKIITELGFLETPGILGNKLIDPDKSDGYQLIQHDHGRYKSILKSPPFVGLSNLELRWLKNVIEDKRISLFVSDETLTCIKDDLSDIEPLYNESYFESVNVHEGGDEYDSRDYIDNFKLINLAIKDKKVLKITYESERAQRITGYFAPYSMMHSIKNDKFQVKAIRTNRKVLNNYVLNIGGITAIEATDKIYPEDIESLIKDKDKHMVEIELTDMRNAFERCFIQLSNYERISEYDEETGKCTLKIFYEGRYETELLILLMSFGPALKVLGPKKFRDQVVERLLKQKKSIIK